MVSDFVIVPVEINTTATQEGNGRARVVHGSSQAPSIDVLVNDDVVIEGLQYGRASDAGELPAGEYSVKLNAAGTSTTALDLGQVPVEANKSYVLIAIGEPGSTEEPLTVVSYAVDVVVG